MPQPAPLDKLQASALALNDAELARLAQNGFVISDRRRFPSFVEGWLAIFKADLPLYVSADSLLHAMHRSYDSVLVRIELAALRLKLQALLEGIRANLSRGDAVRLPQHAREDVDLFTGVALALLTGRAPAPVAGASPTDMAAFAQRAMAAQGVEQMALFGSARDIDFSQFKPRGHYEGIPQLASYFRAVVWLGRIDAVMATPNHGSLEVRRREIALALGLRALMGAPEMAAWKLIDATLNTFVGERDAMSPGDVDRFFADLGITTASQLDDVPDDKIASVIAAGGYGAQRILSDLVEGDADGARSRPRVFSFMGQRYTVDSDVLSSVVYDRVQQPHKPPRMMPSPLDVAYGVLENDEARRLLDPEIDRYGYGPNLQQVRGRIDSLDGAYWDSSLYTLWLAALRTLSNGPGAAPPAVATTDAWDRRLLSTQLASWAELRHDTLLYAKQSYTSMMICSFPDAYVEPYPAFYRRLAAYGTRGKEIFDSLALGNGPGQPSAFELMADVAGRLGHIAEAQERGQAVSREDLDFVNRAVAEDPPHAAGCTMTPRSAHGWYVSLFDNEDVLKFKPTIADVHTQPTDEGGNMVGRVLHVGTGAPRLLVVNVDGVRWFAGVVSDYAAVITEHFQRLTDGEWKQRIEHDNPEDVPWMKDLVVRGSLR